MEKNHAQVLALHRTRQGAEQLRRIVAESPLARLAGLEATAEDFERRAHELAPDVALIELDPSDGSQTDLLERLRRGLPRMPVVVLSKSQDPAHILLAMRLGVREYLVDPAGPQDFNEAVLRLQRRAAATAAPAGKLVAVIGVKGGVGTSTLAVNLAWSLSQDLGIRVALMDLDLWGGDLATMLDLEPARDLSDVAANFDRLDPILLDGLMSEAAPGLRLLAAPKDPVEAEEVKAEHVSRALDHMLDTHAMVLADLPTRLDEVGLAALDRADRIIMVVEPTVVGLKGARRLAGLMERLGQNPAKLIVVLNREGAEGSLTARETRKVLGQMAALGLPNDTKTVMESSNSGRPALRDWPRAKWSKSVKTLARTLLDGMEAAA